MKNSIYLLLSLTFLLISCTRNPKYPEFEKSMDKFISDAVEKLDIQFGISLAVVKDNQIIYEHYSGFADPDRNLKVEPNTCFYIASSTKSFTALATLKLVDQGILNMEKSLQDYFPELEFDPELHADKITLHHLLSHTSGIDNFPIVLATAYTGIHDDESLLKLLELYSTPNQDAPLGEFEYTNVGYVIAGMIMKRETGKDWQKVLAEEVFEPAGMKQTSAYISEATKKGWEVAKPTSQLLKEGVIEVLDLEKQDNTMHPAGGMVTTAEDLGKWLILQLNEGYRGCKQVFDPELIKESHEVQAKQDNRFRSIERFGYGYGWNLGETPAGDTLIHHFGGFSGAHAEVSFVQSKNTGIAVMCNESDLGGEIALMLTYYIYDYFGDRENLDEFYSDRLNDLGDKIENIYQRIRESRAERAKRTWELELPFADYAGDYHHDYLGTIQVRNPEENDLTVKFGNLHSPPAEPFPRPNSIRVELIPGSGNVLQFELEDEKVKDAVINGIEFNRIEN